MNILWTPEGDAFLALRWSEGVSCSEIAQEMGVTKNAVIGRAHRIKLPPRPSPIRRGMGPTQRQRRDRPVKKPGPVTLAPLASVTAGIQTINAPIICPPDKKSPELLSASPTIFKPRRATACQWPSGNRPVKFDCSADAEVDRPYCAEHCARAYIRVVKGEPAPVVGGQLAYTPGATKTAMPTRINLGGRARGAGKMRRL